MRRPVPRAAAAGVAPAEGGFSPHASTCAAPCRGAHRAGGTRHFFQVAHAERASDGEPPRRRLGTRRSPRPAKHLAGLVRLDARCPAFHEGLGGVAHQVVEPALPGLGARMGTGAQTKQANRLEGTSGGPGSGASRPRPHDRVHEGRQGGRVAVVGRRPGDVARTGMQGGPRRQREEPVSLPTASAITPTGHAHRSARRIDLCPGDLAANGDPPLARPRPVPASSACHRALLPVGVPGK